MGERARSLPPVRVRITAAATLVTAVTVVATGWFLVRTVESTQLGSLSHRTQDRVEEVSRKLAAGSSLQEAVDDPTTDILVQVSDESGCPVAMGPQVVTSDGRAAVGFAFTGPPGDGGSSVVAGGVDREQVTGSAGGAPSGDDPATNDGDPPPGASIAGVSSDGHLTIRRHDGTTFECPIPAGMVPPPDKAAPEAQAGSPEQSTTDRLQIFNQGAVSRFPLEQVARRVEIGGHTYTIQAASPVDEVRRSVGAVRGGLWWVLPALITMVAAVAWVLVGRALRPVEAIRAEVEAIGGATMHRRVPEPPSGDEVGRLARTMNAMLGRLEASARRQRQFVSDASHELRSPVAAIRADVEVAQLEGAGADWQAVAESVLREEARLERLIDDLLVLAAADEGGSPPRLAPVDLVALLGEDADRARRVPVAVQVTAPERAAIVEGDAAQLRRVVGNLLDNAARHARTQVGVTVAAYSGVVQLTVDDDGTGIAPADRAQVFERFARLDEGRARDQGGTGLGLAVVHSLVTRHGGTVGIGDSPEGGARFVVDLPAAPALAAPDGRPEPTGPGGGPPALRSSRPPAGSWSADGAPRRGRPAHTDSVPT